MCEVPKSRKQELSDSHVHSLRTVPFRQAAYMTQFLTNLMIHEYGQIADKFLYLYTTLENTVSLEDCSPSPCISYVYVRLKCDCGAAVISL